MGNWQSKVEFTIMLLPPRENRLCSRFPSREGPSDYARERGNPFRWKNDIECADQPATMTSTRALQLATTARLLGGESRRCRLDWAGLIAGTRAAGLGRTGPTTVASEELLERVSGNKMTSAAIAVVVPTDIVRPVLLIRIRRMGLLHSCFVWCFLRKLKMLPLLMVLLRLLPSLLPELASGTEVKTRLMPGRGGCGRGVLALVVVISPKGGR